MDNLLSQLHSQMAAYSIPPTEFGDSNPGPSSRGRQRNPSIPPDGIEKQSASTPNNEKGTGVDRGGNNQPPPPHHIILVETPTQTMIQTMMTMERMTEGERAAGQHQLLGDHLFPEMLPPEHGQC